MAGQGINDTKHASGTSVSLSSDGSLSLKRKKFAAAAVPALEPVSLKTRLTRKIKWAFGIVMGRVGQLGQNAVLKDGFAPEWCLSALFVLLLCLAAALQHTSSLSLELKGMQAQLGYCDAHKAMLADTLGRAPPTFNHTMIKSLPGRPTPMMEAVCPPAAHQQYGGLPRVTHTRPEEKVYASVVSTTWAVSTRLFAALLAVAFVVGSWLAVYKMDSLPEPAQVFLHAVLRRDQPRAPALATGIPLSKHVAYKLDTWFSKNNWSKIVALLWLILALIYLGGLGIYTVSGRSLFDAFWVAIAGAGFDWRYSEEGVASGFFLRSMSVVVSIGGMFITALLLGIVSDTIGEWMEDLRKGKADVLESGHSLILGWSEKLLPIVDQLCNANASEGGRPIVILAELEKQVMEEAIIKHGPNLRGSTVICRSGNPLLSNDLNKVSCAEARSIIVLAAPGPPQASDARVLRITLSLLGLHDRLRNEEGLPGLQAHIVVEVCDMDNEPLVRMVGGIAVETVVSHDIIGRLMIQCARQPGLATVWEQLMGFDGGCSHDGLQGDEFYLKDWPQLTGYTFQEALVSFPAATPIGVKENASGKVVLNPEDDYIIQDGDKIIVLAEDDDTYEAAEPAELEIQMTCPDWKPKKRMERILFLGWRRDMHDIIGVLDKFVDQGSELWLYNEVPWDQREELLVKGGLDPKKDLFNLTLRYNEPALQGDPVDRQSLEQLRPESFSSILILADDTEVWNMGSGANITDADSRCLASLLLLRDIQSSRMHFNNARMSVLVPTAHSTAQRSWFESKSTSNSNRNIDNSSWSDKLTGAVQRTVIISEILDSRTRQLVQGLRVSEFVMSNELVSMTLAMVSESREVNTILKELFTPEGNELYVHPASRYLRVGEDLNFFELMIRCRVKREIVIGYKNFDMEKPAVNPKDKSARILNVEDTACIVVMAKGTPGRDTQP